MTLAQFVIYIIIAAIVGLVAERIVGAGPWGLLGSILVGLLGIWVMLNVFHWAVPGDLMVEGVPVLTAIIGAIIVDVVLTLLIRGTGPRRTWRRL